MGSVQPSREHVADIEFGWPLLEQLADLRIGHAMAVRERDVIAVEATEGLSSMIDRAGGLCRRKGWVLLATAAAGRAPVTVRTIEQLAAAGGRCLGLAADRVALADKQAVVAAADRARIALVGVAGRGPAPGPGPG